MSHYDMLDEHFQKFAENCGVDYSVKGLIAAHGDKFYYYESLFKKNGFEFWQGVAIGLLSYINPWAQNVRQTDKGFIKFEDWFVNNKDQFIDKFPAPVEYEIVWTAPDGFFGKEKACCYGEAKKIKWDYQREACNVSITKSGEEVIED